MNLEHNHDHFLEHDYEHDQPHEHNDHELDHEHEHTHEHPNEHDHWQMDWLLLSKMMSMIILGGISLFLGLIPIYLVKKFGLNNNNGINEGKIKYVWTAINCFGAGVILTICFTHLLPEVNEMLEASCQKHHG